MSNIVFRFFSSSPDHQTMASLRTSLLTSHAIGALRRPSAGVQPPSVTFITPALPNLQKLRLTNEIREQVKESWHPLYASSTNPSEGSDDTKTSNTAQGPPFLTILAGLVVFLIICWLIGSILMWLIGLVVHPPQLK
ncbi:uncharacterized protein LOC105173378 [Sesamum indicum]|uniref:Uncharacterized protein LOC105173378 n=1 Tax=Sesamum indicum TaxID=4182 RepID=A0A6I9U0D0_SESIN|nr:uncharacterized protein LOC105173378 [Sesamum indicum]